MKELIIQKAAKEPSLGDSCWDTIKEEMLDCTNQNGGLSYPETSFKAVRTDRGIVIKYISAERNPLARYSKRNDPVYLDSCVEFFFMPNPSNDKRYMNFELSAGKGLLIGLGEKRHNRDYLSFDIEDFCIETVIKEDCWQAKLFIPFSFVLKYFDKIEPVIYGNFYKCGDETAVKHYLTWNYVETNRPDFHRPECFGKIIIDQDIK